MNLYQKLQGELIRALSVAHAWGESSVADDETNKLLDVVDAQLQDARKTLKALIKEQEE